MITCFNCYVEIDADQLIEVRSKSAARSRSSTAARFPWNMSRVPSMLALDDYQIVTRCVCAGACYRSNGKHDDTGPVIGIDIPYKSDLI